MMLENIRPGKNGPEGVEVSRELNRGKENKPKQYSFSSSRFTCLPDLS